MIWLPKNAGVLALAREDAPLPQEKELSPRDTGSDGMKTADSLNLQKTVRPINGKAKKKGIYECRWVSSLQKARGRQGIR